MLTVTLKDEPADGPDVLYEIRNDGHKDLDSVMVQRPETTDRVRYPIARVGVTDFEDRIELGPLRLGEASSFLLKVGSTPTPPEFRVRITCRAGEAELVRLVRESYDPVAAAGLEQAELDGDPAPVEWADAGPVAYRDLWGDFVHDSGRSITWEMFGAPRSKITEHAMAALLAPHADFARKRVALLYRPHTPDESTKVAERDANTANFVAQQSKKRPSATAQLVQRAAEQSRQEVAAGAASVRFSLLVTVTVRYDGDLAQAVSTLESRGRAVPIRLRRVYGAQAAGFAATLPVGFVPWEHTMVTANLREWL